MKRRRLFRVIAAAAALLTPQISTAHDTGVDLTHLPLGDNRLSDAPKAGWIWACHIEARGGPGDNLPLGPWIKPDGTYDLTAKAVVGGAITWPHRFMMSQTGTMRVFSSNDLPDHATGIFPITPDSPVFPYDRNPSHIAAQDMRIELPLNPAMAPQPGCAPGAVGILLSGVVLFNALDAIGRDAVAHEVQDKCQGHPQRSATYHYHSLTNCIDDKPAPGAHSALVGYALDGFGIYGRFGEGGKVLTSADLDACHGHTHKILWDGKMVEMYHYHGTWDFPYTVGCMRGTVDFRNVAIVSGAPNGPPGARSRDAGPPGARPGGNFGDRRGPPDLNGAAARLGVSVERLVQALGPPPPSLSAAAAKLGVSEDTLMRALRP